MDVLLTYYTVYTVMDIETRLYGDRDLDLPGIWMYMDTCADCI